MNREQRRRAAEEARRSRQEEAAMLGSQDVDFHRMIRDFRLQCPSSMPVDTANPCAEPDGITVVVRKRPIQSHELANREIDCVTARNPFAIVHERKFKVDGITKCLESHQFEFDRVFGEDASTDDVYRTVAQPLVPWAIETGGHATLFAYGQTGSGKTHTMTGLQHMLAAQIFDEARGRSGGALDVSLSFFEIYGGRPYDLLNGRAKLETLEDGRSEVQIAGLTERSASSAEGMLQCIELGNSLRTTHATAINRDSSRSHAVCSVFLRAAGGVHAKLTLVDLAGSERAADSKSSIRQRRIEGAQINKSLLALKECIRAMAEPREAHVPFRASKLTLVLRDAFVPRCPSKTVMIACISPGITSADHSINTLRYSDHLKDHRGRGGSGPVDGGDAPERAGRRHTSNVPPVRESKSPEPRQPSRRRSPSPAGASARTARLAAAGSPPRDEPADCSLLAATEEDVSAHDLDAEQVSPPQRHSPWEDPGRAEHGVHVHPAKCSHPATASSGGRQPIPRRGRQPTLRHHGAGVPNRPDALGSRGHHQHGGAGAAEDVGARGSTGGHEHRGQPAWPATAQSPPPQTAVSPQQSHGSTSTIQVRESSGAILAPAARTPRATTRAVVTSPAAPPAAMAMVAARSGSDLHQQDNRYLHNTLTSEVFERGDAAGGVGVVDVGVEDLTDLAHMEALDEVRQWEDHIVSQHMVALQEDARLLTAESELLSQVQQGSAYDIDRYVCEVDKVVRRKMEVYAEFLADLEAFKAQLRREETLSQSCQRHRGGSAIGPPAKPPPTPQLLTLAAAHATGPADSDCGAPQCSPRAMTRVELGGGGNRHVLEVFAGAGAPPALQRAPHTPRLTVAA